MELHARRNEAMTMSRSEVSLLSVPPKAQSRGGQTDRHRLQKEKEEADDGSTYGIKRALPVVGDVGLAFRGFLEDPFVTFIRGHLSHQPAEGFKITSTKHSIIIILHACSKSNYSFSIVETAQGDEFSH